MHARNACSAERGLLAVCAVLGPADPALGERTCILVRPGNGATWKLVLFSELLCIPKLDTGGSVS